MLAEGGELGFGCSAGGGGLEVGGFGLGFTGSEGEFAFVEFAEDSAGLVGDGEVGLTFGLELLEVGEEHGLG